MVAAILPTTNPTSTAIYKTLIALKAGNAIVLSPHPRARRMLLRDRRAAGGGCGEGRSAPGIIECIGSSTIETTQRTDASSPTDVILSTGGSGIVRAAYSSGKPAFGVGPGNVPVLVDTSADIERGARKSRRGKIVRLRYALFNRTNAGGRALACATGFWRPCAISRIGLLRRAQSEAALERLLVGRNFRSIPIASANRAQKIAKMAGFEVPADTPILAVEIAGVGTPIHSRRKNFAGFVALFRREFAAARWTPARPSQASAAWATRAASTHRTTLVSANTPANAGLSSGGEYPTPKGSTGITTNLFPAMTLGCGAIAGNSTSDNISPLHLINIKRLAYDRVAYDRGEMSERSVSKSDVVAAVERYLAQRGVAPAPKPTPAKPVEPPHAPAIQAVDFVCEDDVRRAISRIAQDFHFAESDRHAIRARSCECARYPDSCKRLTSRHAGQFRRAVRRNR